MEELNANRLHVYQRGIHLEVDIRILKCDFCNALEFFLPFPYFCREHVLEMKVEITLKMIRYRTSIQKICSPIGIFETIPLPSCESGGHCQTSGSRDT